MQSWEKFLASIDWPGETGDSPDWQAVESALGLTLPSDYKAIVEALPDGVFRADFRLIRPDGDDYLGYSRYRLEDMRQWRTSEPERFPYPIYPEEEGVLPVAQGAGNAFIFWQVVEPPTTWRLIVTDEEFTHWSEFDGGLVDFLVELSDAPSDQPKFVSQASRVAKANVSNSTSIWNRFPLRNGPPSDTLDELAQDFVPVRVEEHDWTGLRLPRDYVTFIDRFGPGRLADIEITSPFGPGRWSMGVLNERPVPAGSELTLGSRAGGLILWGTTPDGWSCGWGVDSDDPDMWGVVLVEPDFTQFEYPDVHSFSSFLLKYTSPDEVYFFLGRNSCDRLRKWKPADERW
ncbi:hypothetical protein L6E12_11220 [Actinokineospora sp. PR83]|uniref:hypothetical protein n=1 Tax=Actinokineospora sp. PR83 TaxID=2884908 RepID=UPI001F3CDFB2|nr:hypothetical protein [Actinokineospora sp. PR83]MCG8916360.1 hypothetical protein [Actinokineospora sp. PR83]